MKGRTDRAKAANPKLSDDLRVHKPYIDAVTYESPFAPGARMRRVPEVIDCWFDSGAMPFAQWGWPHRGDHDFRSQFPADFISEAIDQTRGWFYSQLAISTLLFGDAQTPYPHPFRTCIVLGHMLGEDGQKMSKSKRNYREPAEIFDKYGADALRWFFLAAQPPWTSIRYSERAIRESVPEFLLRLWNVYSFFVIYARIDGFDPAALLDAPGSLDHTDLAKARGCRPVTDRGELDRWMLSELNATAAAMVDRMDQEIGRIITQLRAMGAYENTIILFASDNGASAEIMVRDGGHDPQAEPGSAASYLCLGPGFSSAANTPHRRHKTWVHEGGISTPLIASWPAGIAAHGELRHTPGHIVDIVPTILELTGVQRPTHWNGEPLPPAPGKSLAAALTTRGGSPAA